MKWILATMMLFSLQSFAQTKAEVLRIMNPNATLYEALGVSPSASEAEIKSAYRLLMSTYHPDRHQNNSVNLKAATQVMSKLNNAREVLLDPLKRKSYDLTVNATSAMKPAAKKAADGWKKWAPTDFAKATAKEQTKPKAETSAQTKPEAEPKKAKASAEAPKSTASTDAPAKPSAPAEPSKSIELSRTNRPATTTTGKMAQKVYAETARCGVGYYKNFIDVME